jgi:surface antigen
MNRTAIVALAALPLAGCMTNDTFSNQNIATVAGMGMGILAGSMFGQGNGRLIAMAAGGAGGAWAATQIAAKLHENARLKRHAAAEEALNRPADAPPVTWSSDLPPEPSAQAATTDPAQTGAAPAPQPARAAMPSRRRAVGSVKTVDETANAGRVCRTIKEEMDIAGEKEEVHSTFCRVNGDWVPQSV